MVKLTINFNLKAIFLIFLVGGLIFGANFALSLTAGTAGNPGHTMDTISAPAGCTLGQLLQWEPVQGKWLCKDITSILSNVIQFKRATIPESTFCGANGAMFTIECESGYEAIACGIMPGDYADGGDTSGCVLDGNPTHCLYLFDRNGNCPDNLEASCTCAKGELVSIGLDPTFTGSIKI